MPTYLINLPDYSDPEGLWKEVEEFESREAALKYAQETFGADEEGKIKIVSEEEDDDIDPDWKEIAQTEIREAVEKAFLGFSATSKELLVNEIWCKTYEDIITNLLALADDIHNASQTPEEFDTQEALQWTESVLLMFDQQLDLWVKGHHGKE